ncbi:MAG: hypothetical protein OEP52_06825 [Acidimicrobiia bacterium]|nr:hypothetical protein [Acidimicrobiia bacterium]
MRSFLLVFYGNTGSSWLIQTIGSPRTVYIPAFEPLEKWAWEVTEAERLEWMRTVFSPPDDRSGAEYRAWLENVGQNPHFGAPKNPAFSVVGFKMHSHTIDDHAALLKTLRDLDSKVIVLQRTNRIKHALSLYRYHEEGKSQFDKSGVRPPSELDLEVFHRWVKESVALHRQSKAFWKEAVALLGRDALERVNYEAFIDEAGKVETMERLADFLGIDGLSYTASVFKKATPDSLEAAVVNFDELAARYAGTKFQKHLTG